MNHNAALIESLIAIILVVGLFLAYRTFQAGPEPAGGLSGDLGQLEETLKKLLEKASVVPSTAAAGDNSGVTNELIREIELLKGSLQDKQAEIEKIKASTAAAVGAGGAAPADSGVPDDLKAKLEAQIKELKGKLEEYEIISEDIADLSFYKEENAKLLKQLEGVKAGGAEPVATAPAPQPVATPAPPPAAEPAATPAPAVVAEATPAPAAEVSAGVDDDLMAEFAKAVEAQTSGKTELLVEPPPAPAPAAKEEPPAAEAATVSEGESTDLGSMDLEKISAEAEGISAAETAAGGDSAPNALEATLDTEKLIQEASDLTAVKSEDKKLMNEFENFVKGS